MKLYTAKRAPNPRRVRIFLAEKGLDKSGDLEQVEIDIAKGETRTTDFLSMNPLGMLPVLELDDGRWITESMAICRYFEALQPDPPLFGSDPLSIATIEQWNRHMELEILLPISETNRHTHSFWASSVEQIPDFGELSRRFACKRLDWLDTELANRPWIAGDAFSIADITALAGIDFGRISKIRIGDERANLARWYAAMNERPSASA